MLRLQRLLFARLICTLCLLSYSVTTFAIDTADNDAWFETNVRPILLEHCIGCHSKEVGKVSGGLSFDNRDDFLNGGDSGELFVEGKPDESLIIQAIRHESLEMPPEKPLPVRQQAILIEWITRGGAWPTYPDAAADQGDWLTQRAKQHWAWQPIRSNGLKTNVSLHHQVDEQIEAGLTALSIGPSERADSMTILRRLYVDLIGLPPQVDDIKRFEERLQSQSIDEAIQSTVDELLASNQFGVHWARHWLDLVRYAETMGHEFDFPIDNAWQYRDAVIRAFNNNIPYDVFLTEHLAGDLIADHRIDSVTGIDQSLALTGWWWLGESVQAPVDAELDQTIRIDNQIDVLSKTFLGMTVACARCHDHKFDAIAAADYYGLSGIIKSSRRLERPIDVHGQLQSADTHLRDQVVSVESTLASQAHTEHRGEFTREWLKKLLEKLSEDNERLNALQSIDHPLSWLVPLLKNDAAVEEASQPTDAWKDFQIKVHDYERHHQQWLDESTLVADFTNGLPAGWTVIRDSNEVTDSTNPSDWEWFRHAKLNLPVIPEFSTSRLGKSSHIILQSPDFEIDHKSLSMLIAGDNANSNVIIDGYFMLPFHNLLFADMRKPIHDWHYRWVNHTGDLNKYVGHRAYISIEDRGVGWFGIKQLRSHDEPAPPKPSVLTSRLASHHVDATSDLLQFIVDDLNRSASAIHQSEKSYDDYELISVLSSVAESMQLDFPIALSAQALDAKSKLNSLDAARPTPVTLMTITEGNAYEDRIAIRGNPHARGDVALRGCFRSIVDQPSPDLAQSGRLQLATSLTSANHPLTARVMVNRVWSKLFGSGLVATPDNFGVLGGRPSNLPLLDQLAIDFVDNGWDVKRLIRELVTSQAYQRSAITSDEQRLHDPEGRQLSHRKVLRMSGESIHDALLQLSGNMDSKLYGQPVAVHLTEHMTGRGRPRESGPLDGNNRRAIFHDVRRNFLNPFLLAFDAPLPATTVGQRSRSNVPAQSLGMLNDPFVELMVSRWSDQLMTSNLEDEARIDRVFLQAYTRYPTQNEREIIRDSLHADDVKEAWHDVLMAVVNSKEFIFIK
jgi:cytochrome c553